MIEQALALFVRLAQAGPVVLVIEDAHWSDRSTWDLLALLVANQHGLPGVLIVVTFRSDELRRRHPLRPVLAELDRLDWVVRLELPRRSRREGRELMAGLLGREPDPELAERVFARSEGNPLFLGALLGSGEGPARSCRNRCATWCWPRWRACPPRRGGWLDALAVAGQRCGHDLLAAVTADSTLPWPAGGTVPRCECGRAPQGPPETLKTALDRQPSRKETAGRYAMVCLQPCWGASQIEPCT